MQEDLIILGLPLDATWQQVKARWTELALELHPDHGGDPERFRAVADAHRRLRVAFAQPVVCPVCQGARRILVRRGFYELPRTCPRCKGAGSLPPLNQQESE